MANAAPDLGEFVDRELNPAIFAQLDIAFPEFCFVRKGRKWVATSEATRRLDGAPRPDRVRCERPHCVIVSGGRTYSFLAFANGGPSPSGREFVDIARRLAERVGAPFPERNMSPEATERLVRRQARRSALETVVDVCRKALQADEAAAIRAYLEDERGLDAAAQEAFAIGLYPRTSVIEKALTAAGHPAEVDGMRLVDERMVGRITVPWLDAAGNPLTLTGRATVLAGGLPKYLYLTGASLSSPLYFDRAREGGHRDVVLVEGVLDAAVAQWRGDSRVIALGTSNISEDMLATLARYNVRSATICLDADTAGQDGTRAIVDKLFARDITPYVAPPLPAGVDPDEFILGHGVDAWRALLKGEEHGLRHKARTMVGAHKGDDWTDRSLASCLDEAIAFDEAVTDPRRFTDLERFFWPHIIEATGVDVDALQARRVAVRDKAETDKNLRAYRDMVRQAGEKLGNGDLEGAKDLLREKIDRLRVEERHWKAEPVLTLADEIDAHDVRIAQWRGKTFIGLPTGTLATLDRKTLGLRGLMLLAAAPNVGKTTLALQLGLDVVTKNDDAAFLFLSLEMSRWDMLTRIKSRFAEMSFRTLMFGSSDGSFTPDERKRIEAANARLRALGPRIAILDDKNFPEPTLDKVFAQIDALKARTGATRVFTLVDYLQVWPVPPGVAKSLHTDLDADKWRIGQMKELRDYSGDPVLIISEAKKPTGGAWGGAMSDVMGSARGTYTPDMVFLLGDLSAEEVQKRDGLKDKAEGEKVIESNRKCGFAAQRLSIVKARDGAERGDIDLDHYFVRASYVERRGA